MKHQLSTATGGGAAASGDKLRHRVNRCLSKLSDRDTEHLAAAELDAIAAELDASSLPSFLSAILPSSSSSSLIPSDKPPLRRHPLRLLSLLSASHPPHLLLPLLPRMLSAALRRGLRDPDSSVRHALVDAVRSLAAVPSAPPSLLLPPLSDALLHEQDLAAQSAAALALAAAVSALAPNPDLAPLLHRLLPRLVKLLQSPAFKAKAALISLLAAVAAAGGAAAPALLGQLVPVLVDFISGEDWAARKAAADALAQLAVSEPELLGGFRSTCLVTFEARRFDKVKIVRESMNRMLKLWKNIPADAPPSNSSSRETVSDGRCPATSVSSSSAKSASRFVSRKSRFSESRSPPPPANHTPVTNSTNKTTPSRNNRLSRPLREPLFSKTDRGGNTDWTVDVSVPQTPTSPSVEEKPLEGKGQENVRSKPEAKRMLFGKNNEDKVGKAAGLKSGSRVVPVKESESSESIVGENDASDELHASHKDDDLSVIRMQLVQIENQQSNLLDLLQRFMGSSQNGIHSLETRVHGLEMTLDEISHDLSASYGRMPNNHPGVMTCCRLPGTDFLTSKFWRRSEGRYSSRYSISGDPTQADRYMWAGKPGQQSYKWDKQRLGLQGGIIVNPLAELNSQSRGTMEATPSKILKSVAGITGIKHPQNG